MLKYSNISKNVKVIFNFFILFLQLVSVAALSGAVHSKEDFRELFSDLYQKSDILLNNFFLEYALSAPVLWGLWIALIVSVIKEFVYTNIKRKIVFNLAFLFFVFCFGTVVVFCFIVPIVRLD